MSRVAEYFGWTARAPERSLWFVPADRAAARAAADLAVRIGGRFGRLVFYASGPEPPPPLLAAPRVGGFGWFQRVALHRLRTRAVVVVGKPGELAYGLAISAGQQRVAMVPWSGAKADMEDAELRIQAALRGNPRDRRTWYPGEAADKIEYSGWLQSLKGRRLKPLSALSEALGAPQTILCLGNGPSSNDPAALAAAAGADAVFRVKHRWLKEGAIQRADVVFSGTPESSRKLPKAIIVAQDEVAARRIVLERTMTPGLRAVRFAVAEEITPGYLAEMEAGARLTNGAAMLATAVALKPKRLIVAGMDLYRHPDGAYPGRPDIANAYAPAHDPEQEETFIMETLARHLRNQGPGSLSLIGPLGDHASAAGIDWEGA